jgi:FixJ family two-component response regulator
MTTSRAIRDGEAHDLVAIVDDDVSVRGSMDRLIRSLGYRTQVFGSADEFLASTAPDQVACLLLDVRMPGTDGLALQRRLIDRGTRIPIVFMTALAHGEEERRARAAGAIDFLRKPVDPATLRRALAQACLDAQLARAGRDVE